jgi:hypothetical protein
MNTRKMTRRKFVKTTAAGAAVLAGAPYVKTAHSAGKLTLGIADHWVPGCNDALRAIVDEWAAKNSVEVTLDIITTEGFKDIVTATAEAQAKTGHDMMSHPTWQVYINKDSLEPVDDVIKILMDQNGPYSDNAEYMGKHDGSWWAVPVSMQNQSFAMVTRMDLWKEHAGIDVRDIFPNNPNRDPEKVKGWTYQAFLEGCKKVHAAGFAFGNPIGQTADSSSWIPQIFRAFGSVLVDAGGNWTGSSDQTRATLEYFKELTQYMPEDVYAWDDGSNNRWIISGKGSAIQNPPSVWAVARRDAPQVAEQLWHHDTPSGPEGSFRGHWLLFWGVWTFAKNKQAAKDLIVHVQQREQVAKLVKASAGYDMAAQMSMGDLPVWNEEKPPEGTLYNYMPQGDEKLFMAGTPAPPSIAAQINNQNIHTNMVAKVCQAGESIDDVIAWAQSECEGFMRG